LVFALLFIPSLVALRDKIPCQCPEETLLLFHASAPNTQLGSQINSHYLIARRDQVPVWKLLQCKAPVLTTITIICMPKSQIEHMKLLRPSKYRAI